MTLSELVSLTRVIIDDEVPDYRVAEARIVFWLSEGQDKYCKETGFVTDKATYNITTVDGIDDYALNSRIIEVKDVFSPAGEPLTKFQMSDKVPIVSSGGPPTMWQVDEATGRIRLFPTPIASGDVYPLRVWRMAKIPLTHTDVDGVYNTDPEVKDDGIGASIEWAVFKALSIHDMEVGDSNKANAHLAAYMVYVADGRTAFTRLSGAEYYVGPAPEYVV